MPGYRLRISRGTTQSVYLDTVCFRLKAACDVRKAYALKISEKNIEGLRHYGYDCNVPDSILLTSYLVISNSGVYVLTSEYFENSYEFINVDVSIELNNLLEFGASKDERTLRPFIPNNYDPEHWDSFAVELFHDNPKDFLSSFANGISIAIPI